MGAITCQFVRPDRLLYEGEVASLVLVTPSGEIGILPRHSPLICALGDGVVRLKLGESGKDEFRVIVSGGYAEVKDDHVIILADHARLVDDIEPDVVERTRLKAMAQRDRFAEGDTRRQYYQNKIKWCEMLLYYAGEKQRR